VKVAQSLMAGVDWILPWLPPDVVLCDGRGIHDISASEWVMAAIMATMKRIPLYRDLQNKQQWRGFATVTDGFLNEPGPARGQYTVLAEDLSGKTVLIIGYGSIGAAIEARLTPFGVTALRIARSAREQPRVSAIGELHSLLPQADIVVAIVPLTEATRGLIGRTEIGLMKHGALLVNAARGPVVDTDALVEALEQHRIRAAVDVTDPEPLPAGHPLWTAPNCMITPHIGGSTPEFIHRAFRFAAQQVRRFIAGQPLENVVSDAGY
jgi:phosphoglycerate dehydrogenase-like enzyme